MVFYVSFMAILRYKLWLHKPWGSKKCLSIYGTDSVSVPYFQFKPEILFEICLNCKKRDLGLPDQMRALARRQQMKISWSAATSFISSLVEYNSLLSPYMVTGDFKNHWNGTETYFHCGIICLNLDQSLLQDLTLIWQLLGGDDGWGSYFNWEHSSCFAKTKPKPKKKTKTNDGFFMLCINIVFLHNMTKKRVWQCCWFWISLQKQSLSGIWQVPSQMSLAVNALEILSSACFKLSLCWACYCAQRG